MLASLVLLLLASALATLLYGSNIRARWKLRHIPGPRPRWLFGSLLDAPNGQLDQLMISFPKKYGPICTMFVGAQPYILLTDPELCKEVGVRQFTKFRNRIEPPGIPKMKAAVERRKYDILWARGSFWGGIRAACEPLFHSANLRAYAPLMHEAINGLLTSLAHGSASQQPVQVSSELGKMSLEAVGTAAFGVHLNARQEDSPIVAAVKAFFAPPAGFGLRQLMILLPELSTPLFVFGGYVSSAVEQRQRSFGFLQGVSKVLLGNSKAHEKQDNAQLVSGKADQQHDFFGHGDALNAADQHLLTRQGKAAEELEGPPAMQAGMQEAMQLYQHAVLRPNSFYHILQKSVNKETGQPLTDSQITTQGFTFILAGYDTTSIALSWTLYEVLSQPAAQAGIIAEVDAFGAEQPGLDDLAAFPYTEACLNEALRLHPPVNPLTVQVREAEQDVVLGGLLIPKGAVVAMNTLGLHNDPSLFPEPHVYRPERFLKDSPDGPDSRHQYAWFPFGIGPHKCVGYRFANQEAVFALVRIFQSFSLQLDPEHHQTPASCRYGMTLPPKDGIWVKSQPRKQANL